MNLCSDFPLFVNYPNLHYLDSAATSQKPHCVLRELCQFYERQNANIRRGLYPLADEADGAYEGARIRTAKFIGAKPNEIVFTSGTTAGINMVANGYAGRDKEGLIVVTDVEHNSNLLPWIELQKYRKNLLLIRVNHLLEDLERTLNTFSVCLVAVPHVSNVLGTVLPVREIADMAHAYGIPILVDAAQSVGHMPIDVNRLGADFLAFSGHKTLGPTGIGVLYASDKWHKTLHPLILGGGTVLSVSKDSYILVDMPHRMEAGTPPIAEATALASALDYLDGVGMDYVESRIGSLTKECVQRLREVGIPPLGGDIEETCGLRRHGLVSFNVPGLHPHDVAYGLGKFDVAVRAGHHCSPSAHKTCGVKGSVRASFHVYNDERDIDALIEGIKRIRRNLLI